MVCLVGNGRGKEGSTWLLYTSPPSLSLWIFNVLSSFFAKNGKERFCSVEVKKEFVKNILTIHNVSYLLFFPFFWNSLYMSNCPAITSASMYRSLFYEQQQKSDLLQSSITTTCRFQPFLPFPIVFSYKQIIQSPNNCGKVYLGVFLLKNISQTRLFCLRWLLTRILLLIASGGISLGAIVLISVSRIDQRRDNLIDGSASYFEAFECEQQGVLLQVVEYVISMNCTFDMLKSIRTFLYMTLIYAKAYVVE